MKGPDMAAEYEDLQSSLKAKLRYICMHVQYVTISLRASPRDHESHDNCNARS